MFQHFKTGVVAAALNAGTGADNQRQTAMEADTISKHGRSSKSHTSRGNFLRFFVVAAIAVSASVVTSCGDDEKGDKEKIAVTDITLEPTVAMLVPGGTLTLSAKVVPDNATEKSITWTSSAPTVATVVDGRITAVTNGTAVIIATTIDGGKTATCVVTVSTITVNEPQTLTQTLYADETEGVSKITFATTNAWTSHINPPQAASWISIDPINGTVAGEYTVTLALEQNATGNDRTAVITIVCMEGEIVVTVTQKAETSDGQPLVIEPDVYVLINTVNGDRLLKNGEVQNLNVSSGAAFLNAVSVTKNGDVYVVGSVYVVGGTQSARCWINGIEHVLSGNTATHVFTEDDDVYILNNNRYLWKNGGTIFSESDATSLFVSNGVAYITDTYKGPQGSNSAGISMYPPGNRHSLGSYNASTRIGYQANCVYVRGTDVFVGGSVNQGTNSSDIALWINGNNTHTPVFRGHSYQSVHRSITSIFVSASGDLYYTIREARNSSSWTEHYKNGDIDAIHTGNKLSFYLLGNDVYAVGSRKNAQGFDVATLWINGEAYELTDGQSAYYVFVADKQK